MALSERLVATSYGTEAQLLAGCRRREIGAFEQLYRTHGDRLKSIAYHIAGNRQDAEDAVQDTFLKAYRGIDGFSGGSAIGTWLVTASVFEIFLLVSRLLSSMFKKSVFPPTFN